MITAVLASLAALGAVVHAQSSSFVPCGSGSMPYDSVCCGAGAKYCPSGYVCLVDGTCASSGTSYFRCGSSLYYSSGLFCCTDADTPYACSGNTRCGNGVCLYGSVDPAVSITTSSMTKTTGSPVTADNFGVETATAVSSQSAFVTGRPCGNGIIPYYQQDEAKCCTVNNSTTSANTFCGYNYGCTLDGTKCCLSSYQACGNSCLYGGSLTCCQASNASQSYGCNSGLSCDPASAGCIESDSSFQKRVSSALADVTSRLAALSTMYPPVSPATAISSPIVQQQPVSPRSQSSSVKGKRAARSDVAALLIAFSVGLCLFGAVILL